MLKEEGAQQCPMWWQSSKCAMRGILYRTRGGGSRPPLPPPTPARRTPEWGVSDSPPHPLYGTRPPAYGEPPGGPLFGPSNLNDRCGRSGSGMSVRRSCHFQLIQHYRGRRRGPRRKRVLARIAPGSSPHQSGPRTREACVGCRHGHRQSPLPACVPRPRAHLRFPGLV